MRLLALSLVAACFVASVATFARADAKTPDISIKDLKAAMAEKEVTIIDVNGTESFNEGHIPGAADYEAVSAKLAEVLPKDKDALIVAYCGSPQCGAYKVAVKAAVAMGYTNVKHMSAGIAGWKDAGEETEKAG